MLPMSWATSTSFTDVQDFDYYHDSVSIFLVVRQTGRDEVEGGATDKILIPLSPSWSHRCRFVHRSSLMPRELKGKPCVSLLVCALYKSNLSRSFNNKVV